MSSDKTFKISCFCLFSIYLYAQVYQFSRQVSINEKPAHDKYRNYFSTIHNFINKRWSKNADWKRRRKKTVDIRSLHECTTVSQAKRTTTKHVCRLSVSSDWLGKSVSARLGALENRFSLNRVISIWLAARKIVARFCNQYGSQTDTQAMIVFFL